MRQEDEIAGERKIVTDATPETQGEPIRKLDSSQVIAGNESFKGHMFQQLVNMTSSIDNNSQPEEG